MDVAKRSACSNPNFIGHRIRYEDSCRGLEPVCCTEPVRWKRAGPLDGVSAPKVSPWPKKRMRSIQLKLKPVNPCRRQQCPCLSVIRDTYLWRSRQRCKTTALDSFSTRWTRSCALAPEIPMLASAFRTCRVDMRMTACLVMCGLNRRYGITWPGLSCLQC